MGHKRKGQLTTGIEWHKHLKEIVKRFFWKGEHITEKKMINENLSEVSNMTEIPLLTFDKLLDLVDENRFEKEVDKKIAEKILEAENDWGDWKTSVKNLNEFIIVLKKEVGGTVTKTSLNKLLKKYNRNINQNAWEAESVCSLLEIFELANSDDLSSVFIDLSNRINEI